MNKQVYYKLNKKLCLFMTFLLFLISIIIIPNKSKATQFYHYVTLNKTGSQYTGTAVGGSKKYSFSTAASLANKMGVTVDTLTWWNHSYSESVYIKADGLTIKTPNNINYTAGTARYNQNDESQLPLYKANVCKISTTDNSKIAYCLVKGKEYPMPGSYITAGKYSAFSTTNNTISLNYINLTKENQYRIGLILSSGYASIGNSNTPDTIQVQRLSDFRKETGLTEITQEQLRGATQCAIWTVINGNSYTTGDSTIDSAITYLLSLKDYPNVSILGEDTATFTDADTYRIYGPYKATYEGIVKNSVIELTSESDDIKILTSIDSEEENSSYNIEKNKEFYVKVYYNDEYNNQDIKLVTAKIKYYGESYDVAKNAPKKFVNETGGNLYLYKQTKVAYIAGGRL